MLAIKVGRSYGRENLALRADIAHTVKLTAVKFFRCMFGRLN